MYGNNFGLFGSFEKARILLKKLYQITSYEALIIAESKNPHKTDEPSFKEYHKRNVKLGRMPGQMCYRVRFKNYIGPWFSYLIVSKTEMKSILKGTGLKVVKFIDYEDKTSGLYFAIIEKI